MNQPAKTSSATIELEARAEAPTGSLTDSQGQARRFSGWIELAAAIQDWRTSTTQTNSSAAAIEQPHQRPATPTHRNQERAIQ